MKEITGLIGCGRLGTTLASALDETEYALSYLMDTDAMRAERLASELHAAEAVNHHPADVTLWIVAVPDHAIPQAGELLRNDGADRPGCLWIHTSGLWPASFLGPAGQAHLASMHPAMLFTQSVSTRFSNLPVVLEGDSEAAHRLEALVLSLGARARWIEAEKKVLYHTACVMASNQLIALLSLVESLLKDIDSEATLDWLAPLIRATLDQVLAEGCDRALTGPLKRGDVITLERQMKALSEQHPEALPLYKLLSLQMLPLIDQNSWPADAGPFIKKLLKNT